MNEEAERKLKSTGVVLAPSETHPDIILIHNGGVSIQPESIYQLEMEVYGHAVSVPTLVVPGQRDEMILGTNIIKYIISQMKNVQGYWRVLSRPGSSENDEIVQFLDMLSGLHRWKGTEMPSKSQTYPSCSIVSPARTPRLGQVTFYCTCFRGKRYPGRAFKVTLVQEHCHRPGCGIHEQ